MEKDVLRKNLKEIRNKLQNKGELSNQIFQKIIPFLKKDIVIYYPLKDEVDTIKIITYALNNNINVYLPKCTNNTLEFYKITNLKNFKEGPFHIMEPISNEKLEKFDNAVCIVPGLGFDKSFNRIGYGGGYYDHFLSNYNGIKIGICFDELLIDNIPTDKYDIKMDIIITNKNVLTH